MLPCLGLVVLLNVLLNCAPLIARWVRARTWR
jgi:hypothetical protein